MDNDGRVVVMWSVNIETVIVADFKPTADSLFVDMIIH